MPTVQVDKNITQVKSCCICSRGVGFHAGVRMDWPDVLPWIWEKESRDHVPKGKKAHEVSWGLYGAVVAYWDMVCFSKSFGDGDPYKMFLGNEAHL